MRPVFLRAKARIANPFILYAALRRPCSTCFGFSQAGVRLHADYRIKQHAPLILESEQPNFLNFNLAIVQLRRKIISL